MMDVKNVRGTIKFESNNMDQSDGFLQQIIYKMLQNSNEGFEIIDTPVEELTYGKEYDFEGTVGMLNTKNVSDKYMMNNLIDNDASIRKFHPKSQFDQLKIIVDYEYHETDDVLHNGMKKLCLVHEKEKDNVLIEEI